MIQCHAPVGGQEARDGHGRQEADLGVDSGDLAGAQEAVQYLARVREEGEVQCDLVGGTGPVYDLAADQGGAQRGHGSEQGAVQYDHAVTRALDGEDGSASVSAATTSADDFWLLKPPLDPEVVPRRELSSTVVLAGAFRLALDRAGL
eukprot:g37457.t1